MFDKFIRRPVLSIVISLIIVFLGILSLVKLPVTQFPSISPPKVNITAEYPGANNELLIKSVVIPLERALNGVPGMKYITSDAGNDGEASIQVIFDLGTDPNIAAVNVQNRVSSVVNKLPPLVVREGVKITREESNMLMYINLYSNDPKADQQFLYNYADINILSELKRINGVGDADILGNREYAMRVWLKPDRMQAYNISADDVMKALDEQSIEASPGKTGESSGKRSEAFEYVLKYSGRYNTKEQYGNIILRANPDGEILRLKDVADIEFGSSMYDIYSTLNGKPSAAIVIKQSYGSNASEVIKNIKALMADLKENNLPKGMDYEISYDVSKFLDASMEKVVHTLFEAFVLVGIVVFLFLGDWRSTLIPALAVPVSLVGTFALMSFFGITLNLISLFALVMAIGVVVDDAIVVIEAVHAKMEEKNLSPLRATEEAMREISGAIIAITFVMAAVFIPVAFMSGPVGIFYRQFSITMATSIILSGIVALTLTPALCAMILKNNHNQPRKKTMLNKFLLKFNNLFNKGSFKYEKVLTKTVNKRTVTFGILLAFCAGVFFLNNSLPSGFIPNEDQGMFYAIIQTPPGSTLERTNEVSQKLQKIAEGIDGVSSVSSLAGYEILTEGTGANSGTCLINLKSWDERSKSAEEIIKELEEKAGNINGANIEYFQPPSVPGYGAAGGFELRLLDKAGSGDYHKMEEVSRDFVKELTRRPELSSVFTFYSASFPQYVLKIDNDIAEQKGVSIENAMDNLSTLVGSNYETSFIKFDRPYKVMVQASPEYRALPEDLLKLYVKNDQGEMVPYSAFMKIEKVYGLSEITRHNMYNAAEISGTPASGYSSGQAIAAINEVAKNTLPRGFGIDWAGISKDEVSRGNEAVIIFVICLIFVYMILAAQYESFILPLPVIISLPTGIFGAFFFLKLLGLENNIYAQVAMVMLIGLLGKNAVLIIEFAVQKHNEGLSIVKSAIEGAGVRFRPILMTSFAFIAGLIPLVIASGPGAVGNRTIGTAAAGGMLFGTIFGLFIVPGLYVAFGALADKMQLVKYEDENPLTEEITEDE
ncbi:MULTISPECIES: efflux RND transporter permease subunit [Empedobacter]|mgnify:FL=1|uniref:Efflux RND transporter permease subunit n=1 Tax=Empedobacter falsenii TaxID=343874 RepID=A0A427BNJ6_9FLAO|nr:MULTISPECIES: efflux RND transporter permease subunit [Empedobacter]MBW1617832.1 efflux RND transporter permease subunit [Empedobacter falsenii]MBY0066060.1 efflux RND transporter permease subunit [Empedobacter falsenii]MDH1602976.1 efflux RND transporter permease subunit [Empedobacter sp. GD03739]RRT91233.1 efflux RND transporter permease subunit [Empedobacter falsenii]RRT91287.1 efflux RND transporter permease subunit [Empedobacter falsenii]